MELYKTRDSREIFHDTFAFLKQNRNHFFRNFFIINGVFLIMFSALGYLILKFYNELFFGISVSNDTVTASKYINNNPETIAGFFIILLFLCGIGFVVAYVYPAIYLKLYNEHQGSTFNTQHIVDFYLANIKPLFIYVAVSFVMVFLFLIISAISIITLIGVLFLPLLFILYCLIYYMALIEFLEQKKDIWECFWQAWKYIKTKFWGSIGIASAFALIVIIVKNIVAIIPYILGFIFLVLTINSENIQSNGDTGEIMLIMMFLIYFILSIILGSVIQINQGIIFYSLKNQNENINTKSIIDQIGSGE